MALERTQLDLDKGHRWHPPLYVHGPFLGFLKTNFDEGLELIARLVNFATERWCFYAEMDAREYQAEREAQGDEAGPFGRMMRDELQSPGCVLVPLAGGDRALLGDARVYGWSAGLGNPPSAVEAALMALEQYFYLELDASRSIAEKVYAVFEQARSAAFLKVLCDVGRREVALFEGPLRPLLAVPEVYSWDITATAQGRLHLMIGAVRHGTWFVRLGKAFHELEHRSIDLRYLALRLFLSRPAMRGFFEEARGRWQERMALAPDSRFREFLADLVITFDIENYGIVEHPEHGRVLVNVRAQELEAERVVERQAFEEQSLAMCLPMRCRHMIDTGTVLHGAELENFWSDTQRIATSASTWAPGDSRGNVLEQASTAGVPANEVEPHHLKSSGVLSRWFRALRCMGDRIRGRIAEARQQPVPPQSSGRSEMALEERGSDNVANAIVGAVAVLVRLHSDWLAEYPERMQWCLNQLVSVVLHPPPRRRFDVPESAASWTWDCFAAEALPVLWARDPANAQLRHLVASLIFALHYIAVQILFGRCAEQRAVLGDDFGRLRRLLFEWANVRKRVAFVHQTQGVVARLSAGEVRRFDQNVTTWAGKRIAAFVKGHTPSTCGMWHDMDDPARFRAIDALRQRWPRLYYLDLRLVRAAHAWLPVLDQSLNTEERREWLKFWREALRFVLTRAKESKKTSNHSYPYEDEEWILDGVATAVQYMDPEERPAELWRSILDLPAEAHHWPENFLRAFHRHGLTQDPVPSSFASIRQAMVEHVLIEIPEKQARQRWSYYEDVWETLIGIDGFTRHYWVERHRELAERSLQLFERWTKCVSAHGHHLATFARWLELAAAEPVRLPGVVWLERALISDAAERVIDRKSAAESVASLLTIVWRHDERRLRRDAASFAAFRSLLQWLVDQQNAIALDLVGRLGGLM